VSGERGRGAATLATANGMGTLAGGGAFGADGTLPASITSPAEEAHHCAARIFKTHVRAPSSLRWEDRGGHEVMRL
jgi:hypothetical protein